MLRILKQYYPIRNVLFILGEGFAIYFAVLIATWLHNSNIASYHFVISRKALLITMVCIVSLYFNDLYNLKITSNFKELTIRLLQSLGISSIILSAVYFIYPGTIIGERAYIVSIIIAVLLIFVWRITYYFILENGIFDQKIALMGSGDLAKNIYNEIYDTRDCGYEIKLLISENSPNQELNENNTVPTIRLNDGRNLLKKETSALNIKKIIVALKEKRNRFPLKELLDCRVGGIDVIDGNSFYEMLTGKLSVEQINPGWLIYSEGFRHSHLKRLLKRTIDIIISSAMILLLLPLIVFLAIIIKMGSKGPAIFSQERIGEKRKSYRMYKFRSMIDDAERQSGPKWAEDDDPRTTRIGKFIRKWRLDEIPQLWNVLKGDMSFVGPRPEREYFVKKLEKMVPYYSKRFTVKPGLTGWAQVSYGYGSSVGDATEKLKYELFYIKNMSTFMDLVITLRTIKTVLFGKGAR